MGFDTEKAAQELSAEIDKIDFSGGAEPSPTPAPEPATPAAEPDPTPGPVSTDTPKPQDADTAKPVEQVPAAEGEPTPESGAKEPADDTPAIPDSHYRAALHMGYTPEEIGSLYDANPGLALKTLSKAYESVNAVSKQLGELGQRARQQREQPPQTPAAPQSGRKEAVMRKLKEKYEDDPIIDLIGELIPDQTPVPEVKGFEPQPPAAPGRNIDQEIAVRQQINTFFTADEMGVYDDFYGKTPQTGGWDVLTPGQRANRIEVCNRAQDILDGAALAGMQIDVATALERAHLEVAAPLTEQFVRERLVKSAQKRASGITLKPSSSKAPADAAGKYNKDQAIKDVAAEVKKVFG